MTRARPPGMSLAEVAVLIGILAILLAIGTPAYFRYRGSTAVNTGAETTEGLLSRAREEAKASGYALASELRAGGVPEAAASGPFGADGAVTLRLRKRYRSGQPAQTVFSRELSTAVPIQVEVIGLGKIDAGAQTELEGVFFEVLIVKGSTEEVLAAIPIEVNGEFILHEGTDEGTIKLSYGQYSRTVTVTHRGVINSDRR